MCRALFALAKEEYVGRRTGQDLQAENELLRAQLEAIQDQVDDLLREVDQARSRDEDPHDEGEELKSE